VQLPVWLGCCLSLRCFPLLILVSVLDFEFNDCWFFFIGYFCLVVLVLFLNQLLGSGSFYITL